MNLRVAAWVALGALVWLEPAVAQHPVSHQPMSVRAQALGGATSMSGRSPGATWLNPATASTRSGGALALLATDDRGSLASAAVAAGDAVLGLRVGSATRSGTLLIGAAKAIELFGVDVGLGAYYSEEHAGRHLDRGVLLDVGLRKSAGPVSVGLSWIGASQVLGLAGPQAGDLVVLGASTRSAQVGPLDVAGAARAHFSEAGTETGGGLEIAYWPVTGRTIRVLVGLVDPLFEDLGLTWGASFTGDALTLEFSSSPLPGGTGYGFGFRWR